VIIELYKIWKTNSEILFPIQTFGNSPNMFFPLPENLSQIRQYLTIFGNLGLYLLHFFPLSVILVSYFKPKGKVKRKKRKDRSTRSLLPFNLQKNEREKLSSRKLRSTVAAEAETETETESRAEKDKIINTRIN